MCCSSQWTLDILELEGLFRKSGSQEVIQELAKQFDSGRKPRLEDTAEPHTVAGLLKLYFRTMEEPLMTSEYYESFVDSTSECLSCGIACLPASSQSSLDARRASSLLEASLDQRSH